MAKSKINAEIALVASGIGKVVADIHKVTDSVNISSNAVDKLKLKFMSVSESVNKFSSASVLGLSALAGGASFAVKSVIGIADGVATKLDSLSKFSRNVGMSVVSMQKLHYAAERSGMTTEQFNNSIRKFSTNVSKAVGGEKKQLDLFNALGISLRKSNGEVKDNNQLMLELASAYDKIGNAQDKVRITEELFGRGSIGIGNLFEGGSASLKALLDRREKLGMMFTEDDARNAEEFKDILEDVTIITDGIKNKFVVEMLPSLNQGLNDFIDIWDKNGNKILDKIKIAADVVGQSFIGLVKLAGDWCNVLDQADLIFSMTGKDVKFVFNEILNGIKEVADWWRKVPVIGKVIDFFSPKMNFADTKEGIDFSSLGDMKSVAPKQMNNPVATTTTTNYTETRNTTNTSKVLIDVKGNGAKYDVDVDEAFAKDKNVNLNMGWTFAY